MASGSTNARGASPEDGKYAVRLRSNPRYHYRGKLYFRGRVYKVSRDLRDHLVGTGFFDDVALGPDGKPLAGPRRRRISRRPHLRNLPTDVGDGGEEAAEEV